MEFLLLFFFFFLCYPVQSDSPPLGRTPLPLFLRSRPECVFCFRSLGGGRLKERGLTGLGQGWARADLRLFALAASLNVRSSVRAV